jgi:hypothetical protein
MVIIGVLAYLKLFASHADVKPAPDKTALDPRPEVHTLLRSLDCANASFELGESGLVTVKGQVQDAAQQADLERRLRDIRGVSDVRSNFEFVPRPFCEVTSLLSVLATAPAGAMGVRVRPDPPLKIGQYVVLDVTGPDFGANIALDVWTVAENQSKTLDVSHLLPHAGYSLSDQFAARERKEIDRIEDGKKPRKIEVLPPAGPMLLTAIASNRRLVERDRPLEEKNVQDYIGSLRNFAAGRDPTVQVATWFGFVEVVPPPPSDTPNSADSGRSLPKRRESDSRR